MKQNPKLALHHKKIDLFDQQDEIADEGQTVDRGSLTRMQERVMPRSTVTSNIKTYS